MKEEHIKNLITKYKLGTTTLEEESELFESDVTFDESLKKLSTFIKNSKKQVPENLNEKLWNSFENKIEKPIRFKIALLAIAASIALIVTLKTGKTNQNELSYSEKVTLLNEAKSMFVTTNTEVAYQVLFEDELVVVYNKIE